MTLLDNARAVPFAAALLAGCAGAPSEPSQPTAPTPAGGTIETVYFCGDERIDARFEGEELELTIDGKRHTLRQVPAASGARYEAGTDGAAGGSMLFWDKGGRATVEIGGAPSRVCTSVDTSRPFLATNGTGDESRSHGSDAAGDATAAHRRLTGGPWVVEDIAGMGMIDYARVTLDFGEDGRLSGDASCNRYTTRYTAGQGRLEIEDGIALTRRLCPEALMNQESLFVDTLGEARRFSFDSTDALLITGAADGATILARRR